MKSLRDVLNQMGSATSPENMPTSSNTENAGAEGLCPLCGRASICGGLGYVRYDLPVDHPQFGKLFRCPNAPADPDRVERLRRLGNLDAFTDKTFETFKIAVEMLSPVQRESLKLAYETAQLFAAEPRGWLLLEGTYGCGKTHLAAAIANYCLEREEAVLFITTPDLLDHLRNTYGPSSEIGYDQMFDQMRNAPLVILDDLGIENPSPWAQEKLFQLLNHRYSHQLPTVITTNTDLELLDPRIRSRLLDETIIRRVIISAPDYRTSVQANRDDLSDLTLYRRMTFDNFDTRTGLTPDQRGNIERALLATRSYAENPQGWLVLMGTYGCGKTHLAAAIATQLQDSGRAVMFVTVPDLLDHLRRAFDPTAATSFSQRFHQVRSVPILVLDDLRRIDVTSPWAQEKLFQILDYRYLAQMTTVITTAATTEQIDPRILTRLFDKRVAAVFAITAPAYSERTYRLK